MWCKWEVNSSQMECMSLDVWSREQRELVRGFLRVETSRLLAFTDVAAQRALRSTSVHQSKASSGIGFNIPRTPSERCQALFSRSMYNLATSLEHQAEQIEMHPGVNPSSAKRANTNAKINRVTMVG